MTRLALATRETGGVHATPKIGELTPLSRGATSDKRIATLSAVSLRMLMYEPLRSC